MTANSSSDNNSSLQAIESANSDNGNYNNNTNTSSLDNRLNNSINLAVNTPTTAPSEIGNLNLDHLHLNNAGGSFFLMPDMGTQTLSGDGNLFHLDQVNNLVNNNTASDLSVGLGIGGTESPFGGFLSDASGGGVNASPDFNFSQVANSMGGTSNETFSNSGDHGSLTGAANAAQSTLGQEAFTQHISLGSNIQYNSLPVSLVGGDSLSNIDGTAAHGSHSH